VFDHFPKYRTKVILGNFNVEVGGENILKSTIGQESIHHDSNDSVIRLVNFATS
jgi:hypothetical protein